MLDVAHRDISSPDSFRSVHDYWIENRGWNWDLLHVLFPYHVETQLSAFLICNDRGSSDDFHWGLTSNGHITVKLVYCLVTNCMNPLASGLLKPIWKLRVPQRV